MSIHADSAQLYNAHLRNVTVVIPDLFGGRNESLIIDGQGSGSVTDFIRFTNNSPVGKALDNLTVGATGSGNMQLTLHLQLPFIDINHPLIAGQLAFNNDRFVPANELPPINAIHGKLDFTQTGISAKNIALQLFGRPATLSCQTRQGSTQLDLQGQLLAPDLAQWLDPALVAKFSGQTDWRAQANLVHGRIDSLDVASNLAGLSIDLPAPFNKAAASQLPLYISTRTQNPDQTLINVHYDQIASAQLLTVRSAATTRIERGAISFGGIATLPTNTGIWISGKLPRVDVDNWIAAMPAHGQTALPIADIRLDIDQLNLFERSFAHVSLHARSSKESWSANAQNPDLQGEFNWSPQGTNNQRGSLDAHFKTLTIPSANNPGANPTSDGGNWPALTITVDALRLGQRQLGRLEVHAVPVADGLNFDHIQLSHPDSTLTMSALWHPQAVPQTDAKIRLSVSNVGDFLARFGEPNTIKRGKALVEGQASWNGAPVDIPISSLSGQFTLSADNGQFLKLEPGAAKLLGVLSLQDLPRHMLLDFRDVFSDGFAFDDISATMRLNHGIIHSDDFVMQGSSATVQLNGDVDLNAQTQQLLASVSPKLSESVALASSLVGGPVVGLGVLAIQKLFSNPLGHAVRFDYTIRGPWSNPQITKTGQNDEK